MAKDPMSAAQLAEKLKRNKRTIQRHLAKLKARSLAERTPQGWIRGDQDPALVARTTLGARAICPSATLRCTPNLGIEGTMAKSYDLSPATRAINAVFAAMTRAGLGKRYRHILTVRGRKSGQLHSTPVDVMTDGDRRWLVAGYGVVNWVRNIRVAGEATLRRGREQELVRATELDAATSIPILRRYLAEVPVTRPYFDMTTDAPDEIVLAEVPRHPVFEITPVPRPSMDGAPKTRGHHTRVEQTLPSRVE